MRRSHKVSMAVFLGLMAAANIAAATDVNKNSVELDNINQYVVNKHKLEETSAELKQASAEKVKSFLDLQAKEDKLLKATTSADLTAATKGVIAAQNDFNAKRAAEEKKVAEVARLNTAINSVDKKAPDFEVFAKEVNARTTANASIQKSVDANTDAITNQKETQKQLIETSDLHGDLIADNKTDISKEVTARTAADAAMAKQIAAHNANIDAFSQRITDNSTRITNLENKVNKGMALMAAMSSVDVGGVSVGKIRVAGAVGGYANKQAIAFGVATALTNDFRINAKVSVSTDDSKTNAYAIGASYDF